MKKYIALILVMILIFVSTAGCIDIHYLKDLFVPHEEEELKYEEIEYTVLSYNFTSLVGLDPTKYIEHYEGNETVPILEGTQRMRFDILVNMRSAEDIWNQINDTINDTLPPGLGDNLAPLVEALLLLLGQRYVEITILKPDGTEWYHNITRVSMDAEVFIQGPEEGNWMVEVEGDGIGLRSSSIDENYWDSFIIDVLIRQPEKPK